MYIENPKTKGSGIVCAIPQTGTCPNKCEDCFFQSGRSYLEPLVDNLPNLPEEVDYQIVRINDGNDSNVDYPAVIMRTESYKHKFFNRSSFQKMFLHYTRYFFFGYHLVKYSFWMNDHDRTISTKSIASCGYNSHFFF